MHLVSFLNYHLFAEVFDYDEPKRPSKDPESSTEGDSKFTIPVALVGLSLSKEIARGGFEIAIYYKKKRINLNQDWFHAPSQITREEVPVRSLLEGYQSLDVRDFELRLIRNYQESTTIGAV